MSETSGDPAGTALPDPPAANQGKDEPIAAAPQESPQSSEAGSGTPPSASDDDADRAAAAGTTTRTPGEQSDGPRSFDSDASGSAANMDAATSPAHLTGGVPVPGDSQGVSVPSVQAAAGTSEESEEIQAVRIPANAPPGKPDGEVDTRG